MTNLKVGIWNARQWLTLKEAAMLMAGCNPSDERAFNYYESEYRLLEEAIAFHRFKSGHGFEILTDYTPDDGERPVEVRASSLKQWLDDIGIYPSALFPEKEAKPSNVQAQREAVLQSLIDNEGMGYLVELGRLGVWQKIDGPSRSKVDSTIEAFFRKQSLIKFK